MSQRTPRHVAAEHDHVEAMQVLIEAGAELNAVEPDAGWTTFFYACDEGNADCAEALVRAQGAKPGGRLAAPPPRLVNGNCVIRVYVVC